MKNTTNTSSKSPLHLLNLGLVLSNVAFFYLFSISLKAVVFALSYFVLVVVLPGYFIGLIFFHMFHYFTDDQPSWHLMLPLSTIFGIGNLLLSYLIAQTQHIHAANYLFAWGYLILLIKPVRLSLKSSLAYHLKNNSTLNSWTLPILLLFILGVNIMVFLMRPTPGILPLDIFHDHIWNAGNTVSLVSHFPLKSMNIETQPYIAYHILVHIMGAHMAIITGLTPHLVGLQFIFVPLVPLLIFTMLSFLDQFLKNKNIYFLYGLAVLVFGGGFSIVHEVKVPSLLFSSTNFLGVILLFSIMALILQLQRLKKAGRFISLFIGLFLATAAKGSIGIALIVGTVLWILFRIWKKSITFADNIDCIGVILGFLLSYFLFFVLPVYGQPIANDFIEKSSFPLIPLAYVTQNALSRTFVELFYGYLPEEYPILAHIFFTISILPIYILLYFSYRLLVIYYLSIHNSNEKHQRIIFVVIGSLLVAYLVKGGPQDHAYFITGALFLLDALFIFYMEKEQLFLRIRNFYHKRQIYSFIGISFIAISPFLDVGTWIRTEHTHNFIMYGKIGQWMDHKLQGSKYRQTHQSITPEFYHALQYIRNFTEKDAIIVTPFVEISDGRHLAFYTSTFSERTVFLEGFQVGGRLTKHVDPSEVEKRLDTIKQIYSQYNVPVEMQNNKYLFLVNAKTRNELERKYFTKILHENYKWTVLQILNNDYTAKSLS